MTIYHQTREERHAWLAEAAKANTITYTPGQVATLLRGVWRSRTAKPW